MKSNMIPDLREKVAVVTGGGGVLTGAFCEALGEAGAKVAVLDINAKAAKAVADKITAKGGKAIFVEANCLKRESLTEAKRVINERFGKVNLLINGAGGNNPKGSCQEEYASVGDASTLTNFFGLDEAGLKFVFDINIMSVFLSTQVFAADMEKGGGNIINISSMNAYRPLTKIPAYSAAKAGVSNLTQWLAVHFAPLNIRVNAIAPGFFLTNQNRALLLDEKGNPTKRTEKILSHTPMRRLGEPEELLGALYFLCDEECSGFVTGSIIAVDGGFSAYSGV